MTGKVKIKQGKVVLVLKDYAIKMYGGEHSRSLNVAVQGPDYYGPPLMT
jgi:hypothetical protein